MCIFYLALRALDTVEDDTKFDIERKVPILLNFHEYLEDETFLLNDCGDKEYKRLLMNWSKVVAAYKNLDVKYQRVIKDITKRMGYGMAEYINTKHVDTTLDYNMYCHYVAGLVGIGLSDMFVQYGESDVLLDGEESDVHMTLSNQMGLFLQKTNIIRDYHEDILEDRIFWPKDVWSKYAERLEDFQREENIPNGVLCLNELITQALDQIPYCIRYMQLLKNEQIFNFCAIPQVMAIATMAEIYNNPDVFRGNVKIRKGVAAQLILNTRNIDDVKKTFFYYLAKMEQKIASDPRNVGPGFDETRQKIAQVKKLVAGSGTLSDGPSFLKVFTTATFTALAGYTVFRYRELIAERVCSTLNIDRKKCACASLSK